MEEERPPEGQEQRRVYPPHEVQARLEVSASGLRRLAGIYERTIGPLPRDERGRVWPEDAVEALEDARTLVRESRAVSIEAALRGQELDPGAETYPATQRPSREATDAGAAILEELRALRKLVEEQNRRISGLEEAVRTGRELEAVPIPSPVEPSLGPPPASPDVAGKIPPADGGTDTVSVPGEETTEPAPHDPGPWRRVLAWFGFGVRRP